MFRLGVTSTRHGLNANQRKVINYFLSGLYHHHLFEVEVHEGQCVGGDEEISLMARNFGFKIIGHPPLNTKLMSSFEPDEMLKPKDYLDRNQNIVETCDVLLAAPLLNLEQQRSGTWTTIRYARKLQKPILYVLPE